MHVLVGLAVVTKCQGLAGSLRWEDQDGWVLLRACFLVCRQDGLTVSSHGSKTSLLSSFPYMGISDSGEVHPTWPHPNTISFSRPHLQTLPHWGLGIQHMNSGFSDGSGGKESTWNAGNRGETASLPSPGRALGEGNGNPLQYSCQNNPMDRGAWQPAVQRVAKSQTQLSN